MSLVYRRSFFVVLLGVILFFGGIGLGYAAVTQPETFANLDSVPITTNNATSTVHFSGNIAYGAGGYAWNIGSSSASLALPPYYQSQASYGGTSDYLVVTGLGFNVPTTATITGFSVSITRAGGQVYATYSCNNKQYSTGIAQNCVGSSGTGPPTGFNFNPQSTSYSPSGTSISDASVKLFYDNVAIGQDHAINGAAWSNQPSPQLYGGDSDTWGVGLTPSIVDASNFGFGIAANYNPYPNPIAPTATTSNTAGYTSYVTYTYPGYSSTIEYGAQMTQDCGGYNGGCNWYPGQSTCGPNGSGSWVELSSAPDGSGGIETIFQCQWALSVTTTSYQTITNTGQAYTEYDYSYSTNAVSGMVSSITAMVYYYYPFPTVTVTSGIPTTQTVVPVTQPPTTVTQTNTVSYNSGLTEYTVTVTPVSTTTLSSASNTVTLTSTATTVSGYTTGICIGSNCGGVIKNVGQVLGIIASILMSVVGLILVFARKVVIAQ